MQYIGFLMNGNEYTIPILKVQEIVNLPNVTKLPQASDYLEGVTNLRGKIIPIINLKKMVGLPSESPGEKVIVISSGRITFGILVDGITGVISIEENEIEPAGNFMNTQIDQIEGVARQISELQEGMAQNESKRETVIRAPVASSMAISPMMLFPLPRVPLYSKQISDSNRDAVLAIKAAGLA